MIKQNSIIRICNIMCAILMAALLALQFIPLWYSVNGVYVTDEQLETLNIEPTEVKSTDPNAIYDLPIISVFDEERPRKEYYCPTTQNYVRVRKGPGVGYETVALLAPGSKVEVLGDAKNKFLETNYGWVSQYFMVNVDKMENPPVATDPTGPAEDAPIVDIPEISETAEKIGRTTAQSFLRIRTGPSVNDAIIGLLAPDVRVEILEEKDGWGRITYGWISMEYVEILEGDAAAEPTTPAASEVVTPEEVEATQAATEATEASNPTETTEAVTQPTEDVQESTAATKKGGIKKPPNKRPTVATEYVSTDPTIEKVSLADSVWFNTHLAGGAPLPMFHVVVLLMGAVGIFFCLMKNKSAMNFFWALPVAILSIIGYGDAGVQTGMNWYIQSVIATLILTPAVILMIIWGYHVYQWFTVKE